MSATIVGFGEAAGVTAQCGAMPSIIAAKRDY